MDEKVIKATVEYLKLHHRIERPLGKFDKKGAWYPSQAFNCCSEIRSPSRRFPYSLLQHCRTKKHVANIYGVSEADIKEYLKKNNLPLLIGVDSWINEYIGKKMQEKHK